MNRPGMSGQMDKPGGIPVQMRPCQMNTEMPGRPLKPGEPGQMNFAKPGQVKPGMTGPGYNKPGIPMQGHNKSGPAMPGQGMPGHHGYH